MGRVLGESRTSALGILDIEGNRPLPERENKKGHFRSSVCVCVCLFVQKQLVQSLEGFANKPERLIQRSVTIMMWLEFVYVSVSSCFWMLLSAFCLTSHSPGKC